jgi:hypothetical protein
MAKPNSNNVDVDTKALFHDTLPLKLNERGGWTWLFLYMSVFEPKGEITGTYATFAKIMNCELTEAKEVLLVLIDKKICNYEKVDDERFKIISRRIKRKEKKKSKEKQEPSVHAGCKELYLDYVKKVDLECNWDVKYAVCLNRVIEKLKATITTRQKVDLSDENIMNAFSHILSKLPELKDFFKRMNLLQINTHYDSIISEIIKPATKSRGHENFDPSGLSELISDHLGSRQRQ